MILVTGGAGFIGSVLVSELNKYRREDIIIVDRLEATSKWKNLRGLKYIEYIHADELFNGEFDELISEVEVIFHMGACSSTTEKDMDYLFKNNVDYSKALFRFAATKNIPFIYASSAATYGSEEKNFSDDHDRMEHLMPLNPYGYSKLLVDQWILKEEARPSLWFGFKFFNVYGPNEYHKEEMRSLVHKAFEQIKSTGKVKLFKSYRNEFKDGEQLRDFVYVKDVVRAMIEFSQVTDETLSGIYNLGSGNADSFKNLVEATFKAMDLPTNIEFIEMPESMRGQYQYFTEADMKKFLSVLPHFKFAPIEEGVRDYVKNHLLQSNQHCHWC